MIVLRSPKGWTGPAALHDKKLEGFWRAHQVPLAVPNTDPEQLDLLEDWLKSYRPWERFDANGTLIPGLRALSPVGLRRMGSNPHANGGLLRSKHQFPALEDCAGAVDVPGSKAVTSADDGPGPNDSTGCWAGAGAQCRQFQPQGLPAG